MGDVVRGGPEPEPEPIEAEIVDEAEILDKAAAPAAPAPDYDEHGVPSFDHIRDKIEGRYATSLGASELAGETIEGRTLEQQMAERDKAGAARLEEIRRSLGR